MIGRVKLQNGLYYLQAITNNFIVNLVDSGIAINQDIDVWHNRLRYPSDGVSHYICSKFPYVHFNKK